MKLKKRLVSVLTAAGLLFTGIPLTGGGMTASAETLYGDISGNGKVDLYDAIEIAKSLIGKRKSPNFVVYWYVDLYCQ